METARIEAGAAPAGKDTGPTRRRPGAPRKKGSDLMSWNRGLTGLALAALVFFAFAGAALRAADDKAEGDLKKLQGKWTTPSGDGNAKVTYTFDGRKLK